MSVYERFAHGTVLSPGMYEVYLRRLTLVKWIGVFFYMSMMFMYMWGILMYMGIPITLVVKIVVEYAGKFLRIIQAYAGVIVLTTFLLGMLDSFISMIIITTVKSIRGGLYKLLTVFETGFLPLLNMFSFMVTGIPIFLAMAFMYWGIIALEKIRQNYVLKIRELLNEPHVGDLLKSIIKGRLPREELENLGKELGI